MNAIGYMRLSFKDQSRYSLDAQETAIRSYCAKYGLELVALFKDNGQRSSTFERVDFKALETFVKQHKGLVQYMIIAEHDRFSRDLSEALSKINRLEIEHGLKVLSVDEPLEIDTSDPTIFISRAFRYATANAELLNIRARTKRGIRRARLEGRFINKAPFGYRNGKDLSGKSILILMEKEAEIVKHVFRFYLLGISICEIKLRVWQMGFPLKGHSAIGNLLDNCIYAGLVRVSNEDGSPRYINGLHQRIIAETDFWLAQKMRGRGKPSKTKTNKDFPLKGLLKCDCGKYMTAGWSKGKKKYYIYYHCIVHRSLNIPGRIVHEQLEQILRNLKLSSEQIARLNTAVSVKLKILLNDEKCQIEARNKMEKELDNKMESLEEHLINNNIDIAFFRKWSQRYAIERKQLDNNIRCLKKYVLDQTRNIEQLIAGFNSFQYLCQQCEPLQRQMILKLVFRYGFFFEDGQLSAYRICSALLHNSSELIKKSLLKIKEPEAIANGKEEESFVNFIAEQLIFLVANGKQKS